MQDLTTEEAVKNYMRQANSESDWNKRCDEIKRQNNGYPSFWFVEIIMSGLMAEVTRNF